ncbi:MAG: hypothetical protein WA324_19025 [Bryobacteraceae bacterium]
MTLTNEVPYVVNVLACLTLLFRMSTLRLHRFYRVFSAYLAVSLIAWAVFFGGSRFFAQSANFRSYVLLWFASQLVIWGLYVWMSYELLDNVLSDLTGILRFSRRLTLAMFALATVVSLISVKSEYVVGGVQGLEGIGLVVDRAISSTLLIALLAVLGFLLRFPVAVSRNMAAFSLSFVFFFGFNTIVDLARAYLSHDQGASLDVSRFEFLSLVGFWLQSGCFLFLSFFLSKAGEQIYVRLSIKPAYKEKERERLMGQLDALNAALLRSSRR